MNKAYLAKFGVKKTGTAPYDGWTGNQNQNLYGKDLTKAIREDLQKVLCEGEGALKKSQVSIRQGRGGYTTSLYITISVDKNSPILATTQEIKDRVIDQVRRGRRSWIGEKFNVYRDAYFQADPEKQRELENETAEAMLARLKGELDINHYHIDEEEYLSEFGKEVFKACDQVVSGYNSDHSDSMTDYFDRGIYDNYCLKIVD